MGYRTVIAVASAAVVTLVASSADAQFGGWKGGASLHMDTRYGATHEPAAVARDHHASLGINLRALVGHTAPVLYGVGFDYQVGFTVPGRFLYEVDLLPIGVGFHLGHNIQLAVRAGVGVSGVTGRIPVTAQFPVELHVEFDLHRRVRVAAWARPTWVATDARHDGSDRATMADELSAGIAVRWGTRYFPHDNTMSAGNGYYVAALYQEQLGSAMIGGAFGFSINVAGGRL